MILGIDQGTTSTRACVLGPGGILASAQLPHRQLHPRPGWVEHDPLEIWRNTLRAARSAVTAARAAGRIRAIGIANQGETVLAWDAASGRALHNALVWQDARTAPAMERLARRPGAARRIRRATGLHPDAYFCAPKLRWLADNVPAARRLAREGRLRLGTMDSWLIWNLTEGKCFLTDSSTAARSLLFDIRRLRYDAGLLRLFGVPARALPEVRPSAGAFGEVRGLGPWLDGVPIRASLVDQPAALFGQGCLRPGSMKATFGTGCFVYMNTGSAPKPSAHGLLTTIAWQQGSRATYALDGGVFAAGSVVEWLKSVGLVRREAEIDGLLRRLPEGDGVVCVPALAGLAAPYWRRSARAAWLGLGLASSRAHLLRSALEGVACRVAQVVRAMERDSGLKVRALRADGGLTRSPALMQLQADILGVPVEASDRPEATVLGAGLLAARAAGLRWRPSGGRTRLFKPRLEAARRAQRLERFERAVELVSRWSS